MDVDPLPTLGYLLAINQHLVVSCCRHGCLREVRIPAAEAVARLGRSTTFGDAERRLRCTSCGARGRDKEIRVRPCSLDQSAWDARQRVAREVRDYGRPTLDLDRYLETLRRLAGGDLGGDGPPQ